MRKAIIGGLMAVLFVLSLAAVAEARIEDTIECATVRLNTECHTPTVKQVDLGNGLIGLKMPTGDILMLAPVQEFIWIDTGHKANDQKQLKQVQTYSPLRFLGMGWAVLGTRYGAR